MATTYRLSPKYLRKQHEQEDLHSMSHVIIVFVAGQLGHSDQAHHPSHPHPSSSSSWSSPAMCAWRGCNRPPEKSHQRCSRCRAATYCEITCQRSDYPHHKIHCTAIATAKECAVCQSLSLPQGRIALHGDSLPTEPRWDQVLAGLPDEVVVFYHAPFSPTGSAIAQYMRPSQCGGDQRDTILVDCRTHSIYVGNNQADFLPPGKLTRLFQKASEGCCVCLDGSKVQVACCPQCSTKVCMECLQGIADANNGTVLCPGCRRPAGTL